MTSENIVSLLVIASEVGVVLALILLVIVFFIMRSRWKKKAIAKNLVSKIKEHEEAHRTALVGKVKELANLDDTKAAAVINTILSCEKSLYNHMVRAYMGYDKKGLGSIDKEVNDLSNSFIGLVEQVAKTSTSAGEESESATLENKKQVTHLREEKVQLKKKAEQLQTDFDTAMESMERMTLEYAQMYEGGQADGEQRLKNEMYQLKEKLSSSAKTTEGDEDGDDVPDLDTEDDQQGEDQQSEDQQGENKSED